MSLHIGTSGYSYDDWRNNFYPAKLPKNEMLLFYCKKFSSVELNATYYKIPAVRVFQRLAEKTPNDFVFIVKTNQETTHRRKENKSALSQLQKVVSPLIEQDKLDGYLAQFPFSFKNNEENRRYLVMTRSLIKDRPLFVEFRHESWLKPQIFDFLSQNGIDYVNVDQPQIPGLLPPQDLVTNRHGYIRFHGRNSKSWWGGQDNARYDYEYQEDEIKEWLIHISNILRKSFKTYIFFNNHPGGKAVRNAQQLLDILKNKGLIKTARKA